MVRLRGVPTRTPLCTFTEINTNTCQMHVSANFMPRRDICQSGDISIAVRHNMVHNSVERFHNNHPFLL